MTPWLDIFALASQVFQLDGTLIYALSDEDTARHKLPVTSLQFVPWSPTQSDDTHHLLMSTCKFSLP